VWDLSLKKNEEVLDRGRLTGRILGFWIVEIMNCERADAEYLACAKKMLEIKMSAQLFLMCAASDPWIEITFTLHR
jgi:hypothetical protein